MAKNTKQTAEEIAKWAENQADNAELTDADKIKQIFDAIPTDVGTPSERKVLAAKLLPEANEWTVTRICLAANLCRDTWYAIHRRASFNELCYKFTKQIKGRFLPQVMRAFLKNALDGNVTAQIKYLENEGVFKPDEGVKINIANSIIAGDRDDKQQQSSANILSRLRSSRFVASDN